MSPLTTSWQPSRELGRGSYAKVKKCRDVDTNAEYAIKIFKKSLLKKNKSRYSGTQLDDVLREIAIMRKLRHDNVMNMYDVIDDTQVNKLYMVMDFCRQGAIMESADLPCAPLARDKCLADYCKPYGAVCLRRMAAAFLDAAPNTFTPAFFNSPRLFKVCMVGKPGGRFTPSCTFGSRQSRPPKHLRSFGNSPGGIDSSA